MTFNDDEPIVATQDDLGNKSEAFLAGKTSLRIISKNEAPLEESKFKVMLELTGAGSGNDRRGLDLVMVLDVSGSMKGDKLEKMKTAVRFVIKKLSPIDRLSVVTFAASSERLCPLRQITEHSQTEIENKVKALVADGGTNIAAGLQTGLQVLNDRKLTGGRAVGIMLMSDGLQTDGDATKVPVGKVPVHTFGFGQDHDPKVLKAIADNSIGGTFSDVQNEDNLSIAFSQCLGGLLSVVVQDLKLTVTKLESTIEKVSAGDYPQSRDDTDGSVTISFGDLYIKELRKVIVDLLLPAVSSRMGADVLEINYTYRCAGGVKLFEANPIVANITRIGTSVEPEREEVMIEENRVRTAQMMKEARVMADEKKLEDAQEKLVEAENLLEDVVDDQSNPLIEMLKSELQQLLKLMQSQDIYEKKGRSFALSSETSHNRQRFATRGDVENLRLFATPRMDTYLEQAKSFDEDPSKPLPTVDDDVKQELAADPLASIVGPISYYIQMAIQSLKSIDDILNRSRP
ncbi:hypothetical protein RHGRI_021969 [Rhododendron griersonianum]|uniref:VWFA domain-containing protein n=1 Tax=Rhododendron griersonianum TaxID=479676 RepID=A0AAV6JRG1_9ERIC|nr:hypothetical protein RHGRI_021969 [Rhododendron griersonianum]